MMKKCYLFSAAIFSICCLFFSSCNNDDVVIPDAKGIISEGDTIYIEYGGTVNLSEFFDIEPANAPGTLTYTITRQPSYVEGSDPDAEYTTVTAYSLSGNTLTSISGVRVPDPLDATPVRTRNVREGKLTVTLRNATSEVAQKEVVIVQTEKPALAPPTIGVVDSERFTNGPSGKLLTLQTSGSITTFGPSSFTVSPIDYDPDKIVVRPQNENSSYIYAPGKAIGTSSQNAIMTCAGGKDGAAGSGEYLIAFYSENQSTGAINAAYTAAKALDAASGGSSQVARLYVNVTYVAPTEVVGIELNTEAIGKKGTASFWRNNANGRQVPQSFILMKLNNGETRAYDASIDKAVLAGEFDQYLEGRTTEDENYPGWWSHVALKLANDVPPVGTEVSFTVTYKPNFKQDGWTVKVTTKTTSQNPETL